MTQEEMDLIVGRIVREKNEARRTLACFKRKAESLEETMKRVAVNFTFNVLERKLDQSALENFPEKKDLIDLVRQLQDADHKAATLMDRLQELEE